jgi:hypothetical protein
MKVNLCPNCNSDDYVRVVLSMIGSATNVSAATIILR